MPYVTSLSLLPLFRLQPSSSHLSSAPFSQCPSLEFILPALFLSHASKHEGQFWLANIGLSKCWACLKCNVAISLLVIHLFSFCLSKKVITFSLKNKSCKKWDSLPGAFIVKSYKVDSHTIGWDWVSRIQPLLITSSTDTILFHLDCCNGLSIHFYHLFPTW